MRIALTFDDGPTPGITGAVLDLLEYYKVKASFFIVGKKLTNETVGLVRRAQKLGCSIENHSWTHSSFADMNAEVMKKEIEATNTIIEKAVGKKPEFFRPPYIAVNDAMFDNISLPFICGVGVDDYKTDIPADVKAQGVVQKVRDGQIILLHDSEGNVTTVEALKIIIPALLTLGYEFCTVGELFEKCKVDPKKTHALWSNLLPELSDGNLTIKV